MPVPVTDQYIARAKYLPRQAPDVDIVLCPQHRIHRKRRRMRVSFEQSKLNRICRKPSHNLESRQLQSLEANRVAGGISLNTGLDPERKKGVAKVAPDKRKLRFITQLQ